MYNQLNLHLLILNLLMNIGFSEILYTPTQHYFTTDTSLSTPMGNKLKKSFFKVELPHQMSFQNLTLIPAPAFNPPANSSHAFPLDFRNPTIYWP